MLSACPFDTSLRSFALFRFLFLCVYFMGAVFVLGTASECRRGAELLNYFKDAKWREHIDFAAPPSRAASTMLHVPHPERWGGRSGCTKQALSRSRSASLFFVSCLPRPLARSLTRTLLNTAVIVVPGFRLRFHGALHEGVREAQREGGSFRQHQGNRYCPLRASGLED